MIILREIYVNNRHHITIIVHNNKLKELVIKASKFIGPNDSISHSPLWYVMQLKVIDAPFSITNQPF